MRQFEDYANNYEFVAMRREDGILEVRFHADDGPMWWDQATHRELANIFVDIGADPSTRIIILTGTGHAFFEGHGPVHTQPLGEGVVPTGWNRHDNMVWEGAEMLAGLVNIEVPIIAAVNGPALIHAEVALLSDVVLASDTAVFGDSAHFGNGLVPGDGVHVVWPLLLGLNRSRYFFFTEQQFTAVEAQDLGLVGEVLPQTEVLPRAWQIARRLNEKPRLTLRYTRVLLTRQLKRALLDDLQLGLHLEGIGQAAVKSEQRRLSN